jgi:hypothetical protein
MCSCRNNAALVQFVAFIPVSGVEPAIILNFIYRMFFIAWIYRSGEYPAKNLH